MDLKNSMRSCGLPAIGWE